MKEEETKKIIGCEFEEFKSYWLRITYQREIDIIKSHSE